VLSVLSALSVLSPLLSLLSVLPVLSGAASQPRGGVASLLRTCHSASCHRASRRDGCGVCRHPPAAKWVLSRPGHASRRGRPRRQWSRPRRSRIGGSPADFLHRCAYEIGEPPPARRERRAQLVLRHLGDLLGRQWRLAALVGDLLVVLRRVDVLVGEPVIGVAPAQRLLWL